MQQSNQATMQTKTVVPVMEIIRYANEQTGRHPYDPNPFEMDDRIFHVFDALRLNGFELRIELCKIINDLIENRQTLTLCLRGLLGFCCPETCKDCHSLKEFDDIWTIWKQELKPQAIKVRCNDPVKREPCAQPQPQQRAPAFPVLPVALDDHIIPAYMMESVHPEQIPYMMGSMHPLSHSLRQPSYQQPSHQQPSYQQPSASVLNHIEAVENFRERAERARIYEENQRILAENPFADPLPLASLPVLPTNVRVRTPQELQASQQQQLQAPRQPHESKKDISQTDCIYGFKCNISTCKRRHPEKLPCKYGKACTRQGCWYDHSAKTVEIPEKTETVVQPKKASNQTAKATVKVQNKGPIHKGACVRPRPTDAKAKASKPAPTKGKKGSSTDSDEL